MKTKKQNQKSTVRVATAFFNDYDWAAFLAFCDSQYRTVSGQFAKTLMEMPDEIKQIVESGATERTAGDKPRQVRILSAIVERQMLDVQSDLQSVGCRSGINDIATATVIAAIRAGRKQS